jgi:hypothetical protein
MSSARIITMLGRESFTALPGAGLGLDPAGGTVTSEQRGLRIASTAQAGLMPDPPIPSAKVFLDM